MIKNTGNKYIALLMTIYVFIFLVGLVNITLGYKKSAVNFYSDAVVDVAHEIASGLSGDVIANFAFKSTQDRDYFEIEKLLKEKKEILRMVDYLEVFVPISSSEIICVYDIHTDEELSNGYVQEQVFGKKSTFEEVGYLTAKDIYNTGSDYKISEEIENKHGDLFVGYAPLFGEDGTIKAMIVVGYDKSGIYSSTIKDYIYRYIISWTIYGLIIYGIITIFTRRVIDEPIRTIASEIQEFKKGNLEDNKANLLEEKKLVYNNLNDVNKELGGILAKFKNELLKNENYRNRIALYEKDISFSELIQTYMYEKNTVNRIENDYFQIIGDIKSVKDFAGDFNDCYKIGTNRYFFSLGSVMERNSVAFLYMMYVKLLLRDNSNFGMPPDEVLDVTNNQLVVDNTGAMFIRTLISEYNVETRKLRYSSASGVVPYIIRKSDGEIVSLEQEKQYMPLGAWEDTSYELSEIDIEPGDILVIFNKHKDYENRESAALDTDKIKNVFDYVNDYKKTSEGNKVEHENTRIKLVLDGIMKYSDVDPETFEYSILIVTFK